MRARAPSRVSGGLAAGLLLAACSAARQSGDESDTGVGQDLPAQQGGSASMHMLDGGAKDTDGPDGVGRENRGRQDAAESQVWVGELRDFFPTPVCDVDAFNLPEADYGSPIAVVLSVDLNAGGHVTAAGMTFGEGGPPSTPTDEPVAAWLQPCVMTPFVGFEYVGHGIEDDGERLTLGINALDVYGDWCAGQQPLAVDDVRAEQSGLQYACRTFADDHQYDPVHHHPYGPEPRYDERTSLPDQLCYPWSDVICRCTAQSCRLAQHLLYVDLLRIGDTMDGTLPQSGDFSTVGVSGHSRILLQRVQ